MKRLILVIVVLCIVMSCAPQQQAQTQQSTQESVTEPKPPQKSQIDIGEIPPQTQEEVKKVEKETFTPTPESQTAHIPKEHRVTIARYAFSPKELTIKKGDTVVWENLGKTHHAITSHQFQSRALYQNDQFSHTFNTKGEYVYNSQLYPATQGKIIVE